MNCRNTLTKLFDGLLLGISTCQGHAAWIDVFKRSPTGVDPGTQQVKLLGLPGVTLKGSLLFIDSDQSIAGGRFDRLELTAHVKLKSIKLQDTLR